MGASEPSPVGSAALHCASFPLSLLAPQKHLPGPSRGMCTAIRCAAALLILLDVVLSGSLLAAPLLTWRRATSGSADAAEAIILDTPGELVVVRIVPGAARPGPLSRKLRAFSALDALNHPMLPLSSGPLQPLFSQAHRALTESQKWTSWAHRAFTESQKRTSWAHRAFTESVIGQLPEPMVLPQQSRQQAQAQVQAQSRTVPMSQRDMEPQEASKSAAQVQQHAAVDAPGETAVGVLKPIETWDSDDMPIEWQHYWASLHLQQ